MLVLVGLVLAITVADVAGYLKLERRQRGQTIADAIVAEIGRSWLRSEKL